MFLMIRLELVVEIASSIINHVLYLITEISYSNPNPPL